mgnify:CR=1 FL=1
MFKIISDKEYQELKNKINDLSTFNKTISNELLNEKAKNTKLYEILDKANNDLIDEQYKNTNLIKDIENKDKYIFSLINKNKQLNIDYDFLYDLLSNTHLDCYDLQLKINRLHFIVCLQNLILKRQDQKIKQFDDKVKNKKKKIVILDKEILYQNFGLYTPLYDAYSSDEYKKLIDNCRSEQKQMIKNKTAAICNTTWQLNNSYIQGNKWINQQLRHILRSFNHECTYLISKVKYYNILSIEDKIKKSFSSLNRMNTKSEIYLSDDYLNLKIDELHLCYEYEQKKHEEKEIQREIRERHKEERKLLEEIKAEKERIKKEKEHYNNYIQRLWEQIRIDNDENHINDLLSKIDEAKNIINELNKSLEDVNYRESNQKAGYVYIISNIGSFGENIYKIGMTRRLNPQDRINELSGASVPFKFDIHAMIFSEDAPALEAALHRAFKNNKVNMSNNRKEFFNVSLEEIKKVIIENYDKTVTFVDTPDAQQYRETLKIKEHLKNNHLQYFTNTD